MASERRWGKPVWRVGEARLDDTWQVKARVVEAPQVMSLLVKVTGQVLLEVLVVVVKVVVKVLVLEEVLLFSLSAPPFPRTRPAARVWA